MEEQLVLLENKDEESVQFGSKIILQESKKLLDQPIEEFGFWSSIRRYGSWKPTNDDVLQTIESRILQAVLKEKYEQFFVDLGEHRINTIKMGSGPPLVMLHGFGGGIAIWIANLDVLSKHYTIYAMDIQGFARSSRLPYTGETVEDAEKWFIDGLESWTNALKLKKFYLLGHSFGGYLSAIYSMKYPDKIIRLILADPWGVPERPENAEKNLTWKWKAITTAANVITSPFSILRAMGPFGPSLIDKFRPDLSAKFSSVIADTSLVSSYVYHCNAQEPSGESAFFHMQIPFGWAKLPLVKRIADLNPIPVSFIYGDNTWMDFRTVIAIMPYVSTKIDLVTLPKSGHHVYIDCYEYFNLGVILAKDGKLHELQNYNLNVWRN